MLKQKFLKVTIVSSVVIFSIFGLYKLTSIYFSSDFSTYLLEGGPEPFHSVSLQSFGQKEFSGGNLSLGRILDDNQIYTRYYITYMSGDLKISGIMNVPKNNMPATGFPVLFLNHGYIDPKIYTNGRGLRREQDYLARQGYVVVHSDYRNHADSDKDPENELNFRFGYAEDVINGILAVQNSSLKFIDKNKIGMLGHSMGGGVALNIMVTRPELVDAFVLFAPVSADYRDNFYMWTEGRREIAEQIKKAYGAPNENPQFWDDISPINFLEKVSAPIMNHHGTKDESVPLEWSQRLKQELDRLQKENTLYVYEGEPHEFIDAWPQVMTRTLEFFDRNLKN